MLHAIIFGIVEGITEFLPISSTAHLILTTKLLGLDQSNFQKSFEIIIQLGAIASVLVLYWRSFLRMEVLKRLAVAFLPTGVLGLVFYHFIKTYLLGSMSVVLWALGIGGLVLIIFERGYRESKTAHEDIATIPYRTCVIIGFCQAIAMIPGVSRSAATIVGGLMVGLKRKTIVEFSFLLAVPTMLAATGFDIIKNASEFSSAETSSLVVGFITAFVVAIIAIKLLLAYMQRHTFTMFGVYRIIIAIAFLVITHYGA
ncbi:MAG: undecaprenyl-diphosphatase UppP [bacterium]|nr:undecaprenyl-diphosphatase UppP [bacterium]